MEKKSCITHLHALELQQHDSGSSQAQQSLIEEAQEQAWIYCNYSNKSKTAEVIVDLIP